MEEGRKPRVARPETKKATTSGVKIPKDSRAASRKGWKKIEVASEALTDHTWLDLSAFATADVKPPRIGVGPRQGTHTICYYNERSGQYDDCHVADD